jgi:uncharacterized protein (DUF433 family)
MEPFITNNPNVMHGTPCFAGTRVAVQSLFDHLEAGYTIDGFLAEFPTVKREQIVEFLAQLRQQAEQMVSAEAELESERRWALAFAVSHDKLAVMAKEALAEFESGETLPLPCAG